MSHKSAPNAPVGALSLNGTDVECLSEGGRLKAYVTSAELLVFRPMPLTVDMSGGGQAGTGAANASDLNLQSAADVEVLRLPLADVKSFDCDGNNGKTFQIIAEVDEGEGELSVCMNFSSKWSAKRLSEAIQAVLGPAEDNQIEAQASVDGTGPHSNSAAAGDLQSHSEDIAPSEDVKQQMSAISSELLERVVGHN